LSGGNIFDWDFETYFSWRRPDLDTAEEPSSGESLF
jgi:hypothetical protein